MENKGYEAFKKHEDLQTVEDAIKEANKEFDGMKNPISDKTIGPDYKRELNYIKKEKAKANEILEDQARNN